MSSNCPAGFICDETGGQERCDDIRQRPLDWGFGDLHAGLYCPFGADNYLNCPAGSYCPDSTTLLPCPSDYFCPHKTAQPAIRCRACDSGAATLSRAAFGYVVIALLGLAALAYIGYRIFQIRREDDAEYLRRLVKRRVNNVWLEQAVRRQQKDLEAIRPQLEILARRVRSRTVLHKNPKNGGSLEFDARELWDHMDQNRGESELLYREINQVLQLPAVELRDFSRRMNRLAYQPHDQKTVTRTAFCRHFVAVLLKQRHLRPTPAEAAALWDEMAEEMVSKRGVATQRRIRIEGLDLQSFYNNEHLSSFLTDQQIYDLFSILQGISASVRVDHPANSNSDGQSVLRQVSGRFGQTVLGVGGGGGAATLRRHGVTRTVFVENYPETLTEILGSDKDPATITCAPQQQEGGGVDIAFEKLSLSVKVGGKDVRVVDSVTGRLRAGTMVSLMGGSGAGKSSLLNALCGRAFYGQVTGNICVNGHKSSIEEHSGSTGFVPQDDIVYPELTVRENLVYSGRFRLPRGTKLEQIYKLADETLATLGLSRVANSRVGDVHRRGVSGGEKKRVNIGLELMARPRALFLDEPTSGLDSSSALLVMQSLRRLVDNQGVTVCSVIHQPRKIIFELFDDLILLGVGGKVVYNGPVDEAQLYVEELGFVFPPGDSLPDWILDVSAGEVEPAETINIQASTRSVIPSTLQEDEDGDSRAIRREHLYEAWESHFASLTGWKRDEYKAPAPFKLPVPPTRPNFLSQFNIQLRRYVLVSRRNLSSKLIDTLIIVGAVILISFIEGIIEVTNGADPDIPFDVLQSDEPALLVQYFPELFNFALSPTRRIQEYGLKAGVIAAVLIGLTATKSITDKRLEFFREAASGYDVNAYFLAVNIVATLEHFVQATVASLAAYWIRDSLAGLGNYFMAFLMLTWLCVSWALLFPLVVAPKNVVVVTGFFMAFFGILFSGGLAPVTYEDIYSNGFTALFCGFFSPTRYFIETLAVAEHRALPEQSGFTQQDAPNFPLESNSFAILSLAQNDDDVNQQSTSGWYWGVLPALFVGLTVRVAAFGAIHVSGRSQQAKRPLKEELTNNVRASIVFVCYSVVLIVLFSIACATILT